MFSLLKISKEKISDKMIKAVQDRVTRVLDFKNVGIEEVYNALLKGFTVGKEFDFGALADEERERVKELVEKKYSTHDWNFMR